MSAVSDSTDKGIQVLGLCRFSVPSEGAFQVEHDSIEERRAMLYDPRRLAQRFAWFEHVLLPGIAAQKDAAFRLVVLMGEDFPDPWRGRMEAHIAAHPQLVVEYAPPLHHRLICARAIQAHTDPGAKIVAQFRLDDDDAVAVNFTRRLRRDIRRASGLFKGDAPVAVDYGRGILLSAGQGGLTLSPRLTRYWTPALAICTKPGDGHHILDFQHHLVWKEMTTLTFVDEIMFVRGDHQTNDSAIPAKGDGFPLPEELHRTTLRQRFRIELPAFARALADLD